MMRVPVCDAHDSTLCSHIAHLVFMFSYIVLSLTSESPFSLSSFIFLYFFLSNSRDTELEFAAQQSLSLFSFFFFSSCPEIWRIWECKILNLLWNGLVIMSSFFFFIGIVTPVRSGCSFHGLQFQSLKF